MNNKNVIANEHDKSYKMFLSHTQTFLELLKDFVKEDWVNEVTEENLTLMDKSFVLADYQEKEADIIYRAKIGNSEVIFIYFLNCSQL